MSRFAFIAGHAVEGYQDVRWQAAALQPLLFCRSNQASAPCDLQLQHRTADSLIFLSISPGHRPKNRATLVFGGNGRTSPEAGRSWCTAVKNRLVELEGEFRAAMQNRAVEVEWRCAEDFPTRYIVRQARACDIIVVGEAARDALADPFAQVNLVMQAGRPLLVVSDACTWLDLRSVFIAWKDTAEARRAVSDALPLLHKSTDVTIAEIIEEEADRAAAVSRVGDVVARLSRHGIRASAQVPEQRGEAATQLERIASSIGAGVVITGAYGRSRFSEWILGGVTRRLINPSNRCSLLSH